MGSVMKLLYFSDKKKMGHNMVMVKEENQNGEWSSYELKHIVRHSPDGFQMSYNGSGPADLALSILTHFCEKKNIEKSIVESLYQQFKEDFIAVAKNNLMIKCIDIANWLIKKDEKMKSKLFKEING